MRRQDVINILKRHQNEFAEFYGVKKLALFGSVARDEATSFSDIDLLVEFNQPVGLFGLFALQDRMEEIFGCKVDLGTPNGLKPRLKDQILREAIYVT